ncbi:Signal transduction histidine kinase [Paenibacillus algorifonticola]|uniref:histidine kinase n=2 Tax=Paenibacillus algorifonticola TaxID=684063 RepID=A0A1I1YT17_9BACL|nr:Signal transduction histidine kinase [Paenibacillus algorifonticola]
MAALVLLLLYAREYRKNRLIRNHLKYINNRLGELAITSNNLTQERLLLMTSDSELRELLQGINVILDCVYQSTSNYVKTESAMRKMLSNVSHDLKTPLTVIMGYAEVLLRKTDLPSEERQRMLEQIFNKSVEVNERILAFFDLSKLEADDYDIPLSVVDACEVCQHRILSYFDLLAERGIEVDIRLPDEPVWVYANEEALSRVLDNLLSNAVRYGADGKYLGFSLVSVGGDIRIEVTDRGRGIAKMDQNRIFERMYTMDDSRNRNIQGSGLGLAIAKKLTEQIGGRISLESIQGSYTCFTVTLAELQYRNASYLKK